MKKSAQNKRLITSSVVTLIIVVMLILSGPAEAVLVSISGLHQDTPYNKGDSIKFQVSIKINSPDKFVPIENISLNVAGPHPGSATFALNGARISGDPFITIAKNSTPKPGGYGYGYGYGYDSQLGYGYTFGYGYGYGYGYGGAGNLVYIYDITIDTASLPKGIYTVIASLNTGRAGKPSFTSAPADFEITEHELDATPPASVTNLKNTTYGVDFINWTWTDPADPDFSGVVVYLDGVFKTNISKGVQYYNATNLTADTLYTLSTHTVDTSGNINQTWVNHTARTAPSPVPPAPDTTPPASITNLKNTTYAENFINWTWNDPADSDLANVIVYLNGSRQPDVLKGTQYYAIGNLAANTEYTISTNTIDTTGNTNQTWVNHTARTTPNRTFIQYDISEWIDSTGNVTKDIVLQSPDLKNNITITIPKGTKATFANGTPIKFISITILNDVPVNFAGKTPLTPLKGTMVELGPKGAIFVPQILVRFNYTESNLINIKPYVYNASSATYWIELPIANVGTNQKTANVTHFSTFALFGAVPTPVVIPAGGGGGGGGGVVSSEPLSNIEACGNKKGESRQKDFVANMPVAYSFTPCEGGIYEIVVVGNERENDVVLRVEHLHGLSKLLTQDAPEKVYYYVNIWSGTKRIKEALIRFKVENSWLAENNIRGSDVKMLKWKDGGWVQLDTTEKTKDATHTYFEAKTDGFSHFAVRGIVAQQPTTPTTPTITAPTPTETVRPKQTEPPTTTGKGPISVPAWTWYMVVILIAVMSIVVFMYLKKGKK